MKILRLMFSLTVVLLCCLLLSVTAFADGPVDPYFARIQSYVLKPRLRTDLSDLSIAISVPSGIETNTPVTFTASVTGGSGEYSDCFEVMTVDYIDDENYIHPITHFTQQNQYVSSNEFLYVFWAPGSYIVNVNVQDSNGLTGSNYILNVVVTGEDYLESRINQIIEACPSGDDFEKAVWLHDYLTNHAYYDSNYSLYSEIGVLMEGTGVCDSYARAYNMLLNRVGIGCVRTVSSTHAWNAVSMGGEWYHVDPTWDDPTSGDPTADAIAVSGHESHDFFGLPTEIIEQISEHVIENTAEVPACTSLACNYAVKMDEVPWQDSVEASIGDEINCGERNFTLTLPDSYSWNDGMYTYTRWFSHPVINYGISRYLLERDGMEYRNRALELAISYDVTSPFVMDISARFALNDTDAVLTLPSGLHTLEDEALESTNAVVVFIPDGCVEIGNLALANMPNLDEVHIPDSVTEIDPDAFANCKENLLIVVPRNSEAATFAVDKEYCVEYTN